MFMKKCFKLKISIKRVYFGVAALNLVKRNRKNRKLINERQNKMLLKRLIE